MINKIDQVSGPQLYQMHIAESVGTEMQNSLDLLARTKEKSALFPGASDILSLSPV